MRRRLTGSRSWSGMMALILLAATLATLVTAAPPADAALPLGTVTILTNDDPQCDRLPSGAECHKFRVVCPGVAASADGWFSVLEPSGTYRGTILFFSGGGGNYYWGGDKKGAGFLIDRLRTEGFRILQVRWANSWEDASPGEQAGAAVACRPASITTYLHQTRYSEVALPAGVCGFCVAGASGGSAQTAYLLSHFGRDSIIDGIFPISGPTHAAITKGCTPDRKWGQYRYDGPSAQHIDGPFGYTASTGPFAGANGPCRLRVDDPAWVAKWDALSVDVGGDDYEHPTTRIHVIQGQEDRVMRSHAGDYVRRLVEGGALPGHQDASPWVTFELVPGMGHGITEFTDGTPLADANTLENFPGLVRLHVDLLNADPATFAACANGRDDDYDGHGDFTGVADPDPTVTGEPALTADPGCSSPADPSESSDPTQPGAPACDDGLDNDGDAHYDDTVDEFGDEGCDSATDSSELIPAGTPGAHCDDGIDTDADGILDTEVDNDGDGRANFPDDPGCTSHTENVPAGNAEKSSGLICDDGIDNDGDGTKDFLAAGGGDPECASPESPSEEATVSISDSSPQLAAEGGGSVSFSIGISSEPAATVTIGWATANGTATAGQDYVAGSGQVTFGPGDAGPKSVQVQLMEDQLDEADIEDFTVNLSLVSGPAAIGDGSGRGQIQDDDTTAASVLSIADASVLEGNGSSRNLQFTISLLPASSQSVTVGWATSNGTAVAPGDYTAKSGTTTLNPGVVSRTIAVAVKGDTLFEPDETFVVTLSNPTNATIGDGTATGTITNDDTAGPPTISVQNASLVEPDTGTNGSLKVKVTLSAASTQTVTVQFATSSGGTATVGTDYKAKSGTVTFQPGQTSKTVTIPVVGDTLKESDETFTVTLSNPTNATIADGTGTCTIVDDD